MNHKMNSFILGQVMLMIAMLMIPSAVCGMIYGERAYEWFGPAIGLALAGWAVLPKHRPKEGTVIFARDGFFIVAAAWVLMSVLGAVPFMCCGLPVWDAVFESISGFTTTGASILTNVEALPYGLLFWRSFTHWVGGMGVLVFVLAVLPLADNTSMVLMQAEVPGPEVGKLVPRMRSTAKILYVVYTAMTVLLTVLLWAGGMSLFDSLCNAMGVAGTGGFAIKNAGIAYYNSAYVDIVMATFMLLFGVNFNLYYFILIGKFSLAWKNEELRWYLGIILVATLAIALSLLPIYTTPGESLRYSYFQVASIITTSGFATADFANQWPLFAGHVLVFLMFTGGCAGSTAGGLKMSRFMILCKNFVTEVRHMVHPKMVTVIRIDRRPVPKETLMGVRIYLAVYTLILIGVTLLLALDGHDFTTNFTATIACLNNIGPGLGKVGPYGGFSFYSPFAKGVLSLAMLLGRLEIYPILVLFSPRIYRRHVC